MFIHKLKYTKQYGHLITKPHSLPYFVIMFLILLQPNIWPCQYDSAISAAAPIALSYWHGHAIFTKSNRHLLFKYSKITLLDRISQLAAGNWRHLNLLARVIQVQESQKDQKNALGNWMAWLCVSLRLLRHSWDSVP